MSKDCRAAALDDDERRIEFFALRDGVFAQQRAADPTLTELDLYKGMCLTLWDIVKDQGHAITTYLKESAE